MQISLKSGSQRSFPRSAGAPRNDNFTSSQRSPRLNSGFDSQLCGPGKGGDSAPYGCSFLRKTGPLSKSAGENPRRGDSSKPALCRWRGRTGFAPQTLAATRASRAGPETSLGGAVRALLPLPPETPQTPNTCLPGKKLRPDLCRQAPGLERSLSSLRGRITATSFKPLTSSTPAEMGRAPHPSRGPAAPPRPRGDRPRGRPREYSRRPRAARGRR